MKSIKSKSIKSTTWTQLLSLALASILISGAHARSAHAETTERWQGTGSIYRADGAEDGNYKVTTTIQHPGENISAADTVIEFSDGRLMRSSMTITRHGTSFSTDSTFGRGRGACYGSGICESYIDAGAGRAYATTIIKDSEGSRRSLTLILEKGRAVKVLRDNVSLVK